MTECPSETNSSDSDDSRVLGLSGVGVGDVVVVGGGGGGVRWNPSMVQGEARFICCEGKQKHSHSSSLSSDLETGLGPATLSWGQL